MARVAQVDVRVDEAREDMQAARVDDIVGRRALARVQTPLTRPSRIAIVPRVMPVAVTIVPPVTIAS